MVGLTFLHRTAVATARGHTTKRKTLRPRARARKYRAGQRQIHLDLRGKAPERQLHQGAAGQVLNEQQVHDQRAEILGDGEARLVGIGVGERDQCEVDEEDGGDAERVDPEKPSYQEGR